MIKFNSKIDFDRKKLESKSLKALQAAQSQLDNDVLKDSNKYIPRDTGNLEASGVLSSRIGEGEVAWKTRYAKRLYYNPQYNFSEESNKNAQGLWFEVAKAKQRKFWINNAKKLYKQFFGGGS